MLPFGAMQGQEAVEVRGRNGAGPLPVQPAAGPRGLVGKLGSSLLARPDGLLDEAFIARVARGIAALCAQGRAVVVVSSGAVAAGRACLPHIAARSDIPARQMLAAVGQPRLVRAYERAFGRHGVVVAQALLTQGDVADLYDADPRRDPAARLIPDVAHVDAAVERLAHPSSSGLGTGGMVTKLQAARLATAAGVTTVIAAGRERNVIRRVVAGERLGTRFAAGRRPRARRRWLHARLGARGTLVVDDGAAAALQRGGNSLLPAGVRQVQGNFRRGDPVDVVRLDGS